MNALEIAASNFVASAKARLLLERHRRAVLTLRAKEATFSQIQDLLSEHGVKISESSITRFCRKHLAEVQRLRFQFEQEVDLPSESPSITATVSTALTQGRKIRDLRGPV
jgi:DNA-binding MurR/RpiR family transcriptional regulator